MNGFTMDNILLLLVCVGLLMVVMKFLKGVAKAIIAIVLVFTVGVSAYNIFIAKKPLSYEVDRYKIDFQYVKEIKNISSEASEVIDEIKKDKDVNSNIDKLVQLRNKADTINHSEEANFIHKRYMNSFDGIIIAYKGYATAKLADEQIKKIDNLTKDLNIGFMDVLKNYKEEN